MFQSKLLVPVVLTVTLFMFPTPSWSQSETSSAEPPKEETPTTASTPPAAQELGSERSDRNELSLEDVLNLPMEVANLAVKSNIRNAPASVTLITDADIRDSGARDLLDVLDQVPGFYKYIDAQAIVHYGIRGSVHFLLMLDGIEMNELNFKTANLANRFPIDNILRVEVMKGPGSTIYGGTAIMAVINIITKGVSDLKGTRFSIVQGQTDRTTMHNNVTISNGTQVGAWKLATSIFTGKDRLGDQEATDRAGTHYDSSKSTIAEPLFINFGASTDNFEARVISDNQKLTSNTRFGVLSGMYFDTYFKSTNVSLKYTLKLNESNKIVPELRFRKQKPWNTSAEDLKTFPPHVFMFQDKDSTENLARVSWIFSDGGPFSAVLGVEDSRVEVINNWDNDLFPYPDNNEMKYNKDAVFSEVNINDPIVNITLGVRYEDHSLAGSAVVPRFSAFKEFGDFHSKLIYSEGFNSPSAEQLVTDGIKPEHSYVTEVELGYKLNPTVFMTANFFNTRYINQFDLSTTTGRPVYSNTDNSGTTGYELDFKMKDRWGSADINYSFYKSTGSEFKNVKVDEHSDINLAMPQHKLTLASTFKLGSDDLRLSPSAQYSSVRYSKNSPASALLEFDPTWVANLFIEKRNLGVKNLDLGFGIFNIGDTRYYIMKPFKTNGIPAFVTDSREFMIRLNYAL
jgi:outer membrane cobalamin receptor